MAGYIKNEHLNLSQPVDKFTGLQLLLLSCSGGQAPGLASLNDV